MLLRESPELVGTGGSLLQPDEAGDVVKGWPIVPYEDLADAAAQMAEDAVHLGVGDPLGDDDHCLAANEETSCGLRSAGRAGPAYGPWQFAVTVSGRAR
jgi:hypothetical protein